MGGSDIACSAIQIAEAHEIGKKKKMCEDGSAFSSDGMPLEDFVFRQVCQCVIMQFFYAIYYHFKN